MVTAVIFWATGSGLYGSLSAEEDGTYKSLKLFIDVIDLIEKNYVDEVDIQEAIPKAIQGMLQSLDPHSALLPPEALKELQVDTKGEFGGIGIVITMRQNMVTVISPIEGTPAYSAGIKAEDIIIKVDDKSTQDMMLWEAVKLMRGPKGIPVELTIIRKGEKDPLVFTLIRDIIPIVSVKNVLLKPGYGYVWITNFQENTTEELNKALNQLSAEAPLQGLVLDLRDNPGGLLTQAIEVSDVFLDTGDIVSIKGRHPKHTKVYEATPNDIKRDFPIVTLINGGSASAAEIVAGALQDQKRAVVLGTTSFGKGSVQTVEPLREGYGLKYTIARYYTPNGTSIQAQGIEPDIVVKSGPHNNGEDEEKDKYLKEKDLRNHLDAEPNGETDDITEPTQENSSDSDSDKSKPSRTESRHVPLELEKLQKDHQVMMALDILVGYQILAKQPR